MNLSPATYDSYYMPPEWHPHSATLMVWPSNRNTWPGGRLMKIEQFVLNVIQILHKYEPIHLITSDEKVKKRALQYIKNHEIDKKRITIHVYPVNDMWVRDYGPVFVKKSYDGIEDIVVLDWDYNAWGGKYPPFGDDNMIPAHVSDYFQLESRKPGMVLEGGAIEVNGVGVLLTTESVLLNSNRNPRLSKREIESRLKKFLGMDKIIWLKGGLAGDDTDGHIDELARFLDNRTIVTVVSENPNDINYEILQANLEILKNAKDANNRSFTIETLPLPDTHAWEKTVDGSDFLPASYANFYIANGLVMVPVFGESTDQKAMDLLSFYFPEREVIGVPCNDLVWGQGGIHCITQQMYGLEDV